jgi:TetR/AcrR family transcriptional regulator, transcriptional repressor of bet genes
VSAAGAPAPAHARPGRPSTGARERVLEAGVEVLKAEGYAGLSIAKVAAEAGENKALISYHFGSRKGLVAAVGREVGESITADVLEGVAGARSVEEITRGVVEAIWGIMDRDERIARLYFDLSAVSVVEEDVRAVMREIKGRWHQVLLRLLRDADPEVAAERAGALAVLIRAGVEGLALERIDRGDTPDLDRARQIFVQSIAAG